MQEISIFTLNRMEDAYVKSLIESKVYTNKQIGILADAFRAGIDQLYFTEQDDY